MAQPKVKMNVRPVNEWASVVDIHGEITSFAEEALMDAYEQGGDGRVRVIILNFTDLGYMNSGGIGLLVTLLVRANRQNKRLLAYGLGDHYRRIFELTRLNEAISICTSEEDALEAVKQTVQVQ